MVNLLMRDHQTIVRTAKNGMRLAEAINDQATMDLITRRIDIHEKTGWMLRSLTEE
jgi:starvation-inducible DNA-binding protein